MKCPPPFDLRAICAAASVCFAAASAPAARGDATVTPAYYVSDSLVAMYDAICNATNSAGAWVHDGAAATWQDLSGNGRDFKIEAGGSWADDAFLYNALSASLSPALPYYYTQEIRVAPESGRWILFGSRSGNFVRQGLVTVKDTTDKFQTSFSTGTVPWLDATSCSAPFSTSVTYGEPAAGSLGTWCDGEETPAFTGSNQWAANQDKSAIGTWPGGQSGYDGKGRIQSIRLYSRALSPAEIARNALVDRVRFEGEEPPEPLAPAVSCAQVQGASAAGDAMVRWEAASFGWLATSLASLSVELSATPDFASPQTIDPEPGAAASGYATFSGLEPGATYYVRAVAANGFRQSSVGATAQVVAQTAASAVPVVALDAAAAMSATEASLAVTVASVPAGAEFDLRAVLTAPGRAAATNVLATGLSAAGTATYALTHLAPGTDYSVSILVECGGESAATPARAFATPAQELPATVYVQRGLVVQLDGYYNALDAAGAPVHAASPKTWTDLKGALSFKAGGNASPTFDATSVVFPAASSYLMADAAVVSDAALSGEFAIESALALSADATLESHSYAAYSLGSGSSDSPRTICFDFRIDSNATKTKRGCIQYNAQSWPGDGGRLAAYDGNSSKIPATYALVGGGSAGADALVYHDGNYLQTVQNYGKYTTSSSISKRLGIRSYGSAAVETRYYAFRVYDRVLAPEETAFNAALDAVRLFGKEAPAPIEPSVAVSAVDNGVSGEALLAWSIGACGWPAETLSSIALEYSTTPDFAAPVSVTLATDVSENGSSTLSGLEPGRVYWARAKAVNEYGLACVPEPFSFRASSGATSKPAFTAGTVTAGATSAAFDFALVADGGGACGAWAELSHGWLVSTNVLFSGRSGAFAESMTLGPLVPGASYTATFFVTNALGEAADPVSRSFTTSPDAEWVNPYASDGLLGLFDGIFNATNAAGEPVHDAAPATWTDLMGNFPTLTSGSVSYTANAVVYPSSSGAYTQSDSAGAAIAAILSGDFTVESLGYFPRRTAEAANGSGDEYWPLYSIGSGSSAKRVLCFDVRAKDGLYGAVQFNASKWYDDVMMGHWLDFSEPTTWAVAGGGSPSAPATLFANGTATNSVPNHGDFADASSAGSVLAIRRYSDRAAQTTYHAFRVYGRTLSPSELAANRLADEVRFLGAAASLRIESATRAGGALSVSLSRAGTALEAPIAAIFSETGGAGAETATGSSFAAGAAAADAAVAVPAGALYVRFKAGGLVTAPFVLAEASAPAAASVGTPAATSVAATGAAISAPVVVPDGEGPFDVLVAFGLAPDALSSTNVLASGFAASGLAAGTLSGLVPNRTYWARAFAVSGGRVVAESPAAVSFSTAAGEGGGVLGDDVAVTGHETGDTLSFSGTVSAAASRVTVNGTEAAIGADGAWSASFADVEPGVAADYVVRAWDASGALVDALPVLVETTRAASSLSWNLSGTVVQRAFSVSGSLATLGANGTAVRLLTGPSAAALTNTASVVVGPSGSSAFSFAWRAPAFGETVFWAVEIENSATDPANGHWVSRSAVESFTTRDEAVYTWRDVDGDWTGDWSDSAHWADDKGGDCLGYPCTADATAAIGRGTVALDVSPTVGWLAFGADGPVAIEGPGTLSVPSSNYQSQWLLVPDGGDVAVRGGATLDVGRGYIAVAATSKSNTGYAARLAVEDGARLVAQTVVLCYGGVFVVDDATAALSGGLYLNHGASAAGRSDFATTGGLLRLAGANPVLEVAQNIRSYNHSSAVVGGAVEFCVPAGGYASPAIVMTGTGAGQTLCGDSNVATDAARVPVRLAADSPIYRTGGTLDAALATWRVAHTDGAALVVLEPLRGADREPRRRLYLAADDLSLRLCYVSGGTVVVVR